MERRARQRSAHRSEPISQAWKYFGTRCRLGGFRDEKLSPPKRRQMTKGPVSRHRRLRVGSAFQNISTLVKLVLIGALIAAGLFVPLKQPINLLPAPGDTMSIFSGPFAIALVYVMYSYSGWNATAYITGEIKRPEKTVPRSLLVGTGLVIVIYVLLNAVFLATTPLGELKGQLEVALIASKHIFGSAGGRA